MARVKTHELTVKVNHRERYPFRAVCSCGWHSWGYLTENAAGITGDGHIADMKPEPGYWGGVGYEPYAS